MPPDGTEPASLDFAPGVYYNNDRKSVFRVTQQGRPAAGAFAPEEEK